MSTFKLPRKHKFEGFRRKKVKKTRTKSNTIRVRKPNYSNSRIEKEYSYIHDDNYLDSESSYSESEDDLDSYSEILARYLLSKGVTYSCEDCYERSEDDLDSYSESEIDDYDLDLYSESEILALAIYKNNIQVTRYLLSKGVTYSCEDCYERYCPETCSLKTCMTNNKVGIITICLLYTSPSPRDQRGSRMPSSA